MRMLAAVAVAATVVPGAAQAAKPKLRITVLSNRADLVSGGDALVRIAGPVRGVRVTLGRRPVTRRFKRRPNGHFEGLVRGIPDRRVRLRATAPRARGAVIALTGHPNGGPVFAGPQVQPWTCQPTAVDAQCNEPASFNYYGYNGTRFVPVDPASPPATVRDTTTDAGETVPFVVRVENGYQDRDAYRIATLYDARAPWKPWNPQAGWNRKLVITHGGSCGTDRKVGDPPDVMNAEVLGKGFMVMSTALNNLGHNCNPALITESEVMAKEHIAEAYGPIRATIGTGCSGGSIAQMGAAIAYPGVYDGITVQCTFADLLTTGKHAAAGHLIKRIFTEDPQGLTPLEYAVVSGSPVGLADDAVFDAAFWSNITGATGCAGMDPALRWTPENPGGVRCGVLDHNVAILGRGANGYAGVPLDNVGVQWGLKALRNGSLTPASFVSLNARIGGIDKTTFAHTPQRTDGDVSALRNAYRSGYVTTGNTLDRTPIIELRGPNEATAHVTYPSLAIRTRLDRQFGNHDNHVLWQGPVPLLGQPTFANQAIFAMDRWVAAIQADRSGRPLPERIRANRPADVADRCEALPGQATPGADCPLLNRFYESPTNVAGESTRNDILKCQLQPLDRGSYGDVTFTDAQWAALQAAFPTGVCDWSKPGVGEGPTIPWLDFSKRPGGRPLGPPPRSRTLSSRGAGVR